MIYIDRYGKKNLYYRSNTDFGYNVPIVDKEDLILTQNKEVFRHYQSLGYQTMILSTYFGLPETVGLYEVFSYFFDGAIESDFEMIRLIFDGLLQGSDFVFCLNIDATFCWFVVTQTELKVLGTMQYSYVASKYSLGKFMKKLRYNIAKSGYNLNKIQYVFWSANDMIVDIENYITNSIYLEDFFNKIDGMKGLNCLNVIQLLSTEIQENYRVTAFDFVKSLNQSFNRLKIYEKDGMIYSGNVFYKDYSTCVSPLIDSKDCVYGIILDCEGKPSGDLKDGGSEFGGLIFCRYKNILLNLETFVCDEIMLIDTMERVIDNYKNYTSLFNKNINVYVYGTSDETLFKASCANVGKPKEYNSILKVLYFVNVYDYVVDYIDKQKPMDGKHTLDNVAKWLNVQVLKPLHNPVNDARTLFNVLARILQVTKKFVV